ncbi:hypothetical protein MSSAC_2824 [Methanosarcina siciliae C2J]|uniref:Uncharacterized protein n=3 Tax=Methanosarcina siciliae TaxID=38027 RepID=A0A0E3PEY0_9EURY|nr:hypothetical protein [Methanosarcina siciliae]AKB29242.1 hypothetical protein MSSIT_2523 [Methanosarcina siciliae T4/M]AKB33170.1 hypothetical protein MSSIH_2480 [Methanosarcina siciliae HI350]AKB37414.1 hypothetical protein MSSAC_2824 [Methanosarcina siciliae C2J]
MHKLIKIVGFILAIIGFAHIVKHIMHCKESCRWCGWYKIKVEDEKTAEKTVSHKIKVEDEEQKGSRYGSNPIRY